MSGCRKHEQTCREGVRRDKPGGFAIAEVNVACHMTGIGRNAHVWPGIAASSPLPMVAMYFPYNLI
jgi:hypothetical protein